MSLFTHLECSVPCGAPALDPRDRHHLCSCGAPLLARYDLDRARAWSRESLAGREPTMWRYRELLPLFDGEAAGHARRGVHAAAPRARARRHARPRPPLHQGRVAQPDQLVQGARPVGGHHARARPRRDDDRAADGRQRRQRGGRVLGRGRASRAKSSSRRTPSARSSTSAACTARTSRSSTA